MPSDKGDLKEKEQQIDAADFEREFGSEFSDKEKSRLDELSDRISDRYKDAQNAPWKTNLGPAGTAASALLPKKLSSRKKIFIGGGLAGLIVTLLIGIFAFISPYRGTHVEQSILTRIGNIAEHALEQRLLYYMTRYLILQAAIKADSSFEKDRAFTYIGTGTFKTLYTNWKGAKLEAILEKEYNIRLRPIQAIGSMTGRDLVRPQNWQVEYLDDKGNVTRTVKMDSVEARQSLFTFTKGETKSEQVSLRWGERKILKRYYGINNWKPYERTQNKARDFYLQQKAETKKFMVRQTVGRMSPKYSLYLSCLIDGGDNCKDEKLNAPDSLGDAADPDLEKAIGDGDTDTSSQLTKQLQQIALKRMILASAAGLGILQVIGGIQKSVDSGSLSKITYDNLSQQYTGYSTAMRSRIHQVASGDDFNYEHARYLAETFNGFEASPVYTSGIRGSTATVGAAGNYVRDCDGDGQKNDELEPGETVCPNKKLIQDREGIRKMFFWPVIDTIGAAFNSTLGKPLEWAAGLFNDALSAIGVTALMAKVMEVSGLDKLAGAVLEAGINWVIGFSVTGNEESEDAYDATYAGIFSTKSTLGSTMGGSREGTMGGGPLTNSQVNAILQDRFRERQYALSQKSIMERYFSPEVDNSFTSYAILHAPTNITNFSTSTLASFNPFKIMSNLGSLFTNRGYAAAGDATVNNPFGGVYMGYASDHPAINMEEEDLRAQYQCSLPVEERPQNKKMGRPDGMPFDMYTDPDPCLLDYMTGAIGSKYFDGSFNDIDSE